MGAKTEAVLGVLNGAIGDYLERTGNGLALDMAFIHQGRPLALDGDAVARAFPSGSSRLSVWLHGLMATEYFWRFPDGSDYGSLLQRDVGMTPLYLRYNSGRSIAANGEQFAALLDAVVAAWPVAVEEILLVGHSMGGLVIRSACHQARQRRLGWLRLVKRAIYLGTPHQGAPLERVGRALSGVLGVVGDPVTQLVASVADLRSQGVKDLGDAVIRPEDRRRRPLNLRSPRHPVPLLAGIRHHLLAGTLTSDPVLTALLGDAIVPLSSATNGRHRGAATGAPLPPERVRVIPGLTHNALARDRDVYAQVRAWVEAP